MASKWNQGVQDYVEELIFELEDNGLEPTIKNMLNGARNWNEYSYGGSSLIDDMDIAERLATPSEIESRTRKDGSFNQMANRNETWLDVQARALHQASVKAMESYTRAK